MRENEIEKEVERERKKGSFRHLPGPENTKPIYNRATQVRMLLATLLFLLLASLLHPKTVNNNG